MIQNILKLSLATLLLSACSYSANDQSQDITVYTPGAEGTRCLMYIDKVKFRVFPPQTVSVFSHNENMTLDCAAPGNRRKIIEVEPSIESLPRENLLLEGPNYAWKAASAGLYRYPDVIEVSFIDVPHGLSSIPAQNKSDIRQPEDYRIEEYKPAKILLADEVKGQPADEPESEVQTKEPEAEPKMNSVEGFSEPEGEKSGKGNLQTVIEELTEEPLDITPMPIIPGE